VCVAVCVCCSVCVLQYVCVAVCVCCSVCVLQCVCALSRSVLVLYLVLQNVAEYCSVLQCARKSLLSWKITKEAAHQ